MELEKKFELIKWLVDSKMIIPTNEIKIGYKIYEANKENKENIDSFIKIINERIMIRFI